MTSEILLATSMVAINREGCFTKFESMRAERLPFFRSSSMRSLFTERNAISVPDASAEAINEMITIVRALNLYLAVQKPGPDPSLLPLSRGGKEGSGSESYLLSFNDSK